MEDWMRGPMFATGVIGAGVNIKEIVSVIHIGVPYGAIPFVQESGRGGRDGETVKSVILISEQEFRRLERMDAEELKEDEVKMRD